MDANRHPRVRQLLTRLEHVGDTEMRGLPLYNDALVVEGVGFRVHAAALVGVVITPWFINAIHLPLQPVSIDWAVIGRRVEHRLPSGPVTFTRGGDEITGQYDALSLHSPVNAFTSQDMARREAEGRSNGLFEPPLAPSEAGESPEDPGRRAFLLGGRGERGEMSGA
jgi:[NiFe] hydrogenase assembly HybE family chaperone